MRAAFDFPPRKSSIYKTTYTYNLSLSAAKGLLTFYLEYRYVVIQIYLQVIAPEMSGLQWGLFSTYIDHHHYKIEHCVYFSRNTIILLFKILNKTI